MTDVKATRPTPQRKVLHWVDWLLLLIVAGVSVVTVLSAWPSVTAGLSLANDTKLSWHLVRSAGLTAYALLGASTIWGLFLSSRAIKDWSPGPMSLLFHSSLAWLAVVLSIAHVGLLMFDSYYSYKLSDLLVPFTGPYRPFAVGLGTIAAWLSFCITISFSLRKLIGQRAWRWLHYASYLAFGLITVHGLLAGSDSNKVGMQVLMGSFVVGVTVLLVVRVRNARQTQTARRANGARTRQLPISAPDSLT